MKSDRYKRLWPDGWQVCDECGQPHGHNEPPCPHERLKVEQVIRLGGTFTTRYDVMQEFLLKSDNVRAAQTDGLLDQDEVLAMIDRFRAECEQKLVEIKEGAPA